MKALSREYRALLERTVREACTIAQDGAAAALQYLGVHEKAVPAHLTDEERALRRKLRAHGRQLGDRQAQDGSQTLEHLADEAAYEHWHRMIFARFLAENNLLMYRESDSTDPDDMLPVSLADCQELVEDSAQELAGQGIHDGWDLAAFCAARMLPQIFRVNSPLFSLKFAPEFQQKLIRLVSDLPVDVFLADDSLGWVYQYWQADKKDRINNSEEKIGADELPAVTQLFTEPYMVSFLLDNSLGAWWAARHLGQEDLHNAASEAELRARAALPGMPLNYLRFVWTEGEGWQIAAGTFGEWPEKLAELKILDPCCGSGHFLVAALHMLVPMYMEEEKLGVRDAIKNALEKNLFGLELDPRAVMIAVFALTFAAWSYRLPVDPDTTFGFAGSDGQPFNQGTFADYSPVGYWQLSRTNLACSGLAAPVDKSDWTGLAEDGSALQKALDLLDWQFMQADVLGSLLSPSFGALEQLADINFSKLQKEVSQEGQKNEEVSDLALEASQKAYEMARAATILAQKYTLVITNVPYLQRGKQGETLRTFCEETYADAKNDIATVFLARNLKLCVSGGTTCTVMPQNWLFLTSYTSFRKQILEKESLNLIARLGTKAFQTPMWDFNIQLLILSSSAAVPQNFALAETTKEEFFYGTDVAKEASADAKEAALSKSQLSKIIQNTQLNNPDHRILFDTQNQFDTFEKSAVANQGIKTGDDNRWRNFFWEQPHLNNYWKYYQSTVEKNIHFGGRSYIIDWHLQGRGMPCRRPTNKNLGTLGVAISQMGSLPVTLYFGELYDSNIGPISPFKTNILPALWCFCSSPEYNKAVRQIDQALKVTNATLVKVPFDLERWQKVADERYPHGLPKPYSNDPTQWIFHGHPCRSVLWDETAKKTVEGPLRYDETVLHVAVAHLLGYQWPAELDESMELADEQRAIVSACKALSKHADRDGIVCIPAVTGEANAQDRLADLLATAYGEHWNDSVTDKLLRASGGSPSLEAWLRDKFFAQHCKLFGNRPFIWQIWDGLVDGFSALVNYHKLTYKNLEALTYTYLGNWITRQKAAVQAKEDGAQERLAAAENLMVELKRILQGEAPCDIFVRWKPLHEQPCGWNPDLNDGVRLNIRPFLSTTDVGKRGAGILRDKPNIKWEKDRGKETEKSPWYYLFGSDRINDHHLTLAEKQAARQALREAEEKAAREAAARKTAQTTSSEAAANPSEPANGAAQEGSASPTGN